MLESENETQVIRESLEFWNPWWRGEKWREVDFVVREGTEVKALIQVCTDASSGVMERETRALEEAMTALGQTEGTIITDNLTREKKTDAGTVRFIPLYIWLLKERMST